MTESLQLRAMLVTLCWWREFLSQLHQLAIESIQAKFCLHNFCTFFFRPPENCNLRPIWLLNTTVHENCYIPSHVEYLYEKQPVKQTGFSNGCYCRIVSMSRPRQPSLQEKSYSSPTTSCFFILILTRRNVLSYSARIPALSIFPSFLRIHRLRRSFKFLHVVTAIVWGFSFHHEYRWIMVESILLGVLR